MTRPEDPDRTHAAPPSRPGSASDPDRTQADPAPGAPTHVSGPSDESARTIARVPQGGSPGSADATTVRSAAGGRGPEDATLRPLRRSEPTASGKASPLAGDGTPFGRYRLLDRLGAGGMGVVWKAWDTEMRRMVALKQIRYDEDDAASLERFAREARLAGGLRHPNIVAVHDVGQVGNKHFLTMDYVDGCTFGSWLEETRDLKRAGDRRGLDRLREEAEKLATVAEAVAYAHGRGIVHRDLKPANVLLDGAGSPFVMDFGLARRVDAGEDGAGLTASGQMLGTPSYMSPEQAAGEREKLGPATDVYSLGVMLYEILTGSLPIEGASAMEVVAKLLQDDDRPAPRKRNPLAPRELEAVCLKALERDQARRYGTAAAFGEELRRWLRGEPVQARPPSRGESALRWVARRKRVVLPLGVMAVLLGGASIWLAVERGRRETREREAAAARAVVEALRGKVAAQVEQFESTVMSTAMPAAARAALARQPLELIDELVRGDAAWGPAYSLRGRVRRLLGEDAAAAGDFDEGCRRAADHVLPWLLRGLDRIETYARARGLPGRVLTGDRAAFESLPPESPEQGRLRAAGLDDLARAREAGGADEVARRTGEAVAALYSGGRESWGAAARDLDAVAAPRARRVEGMARYFLEQFEEAVAAFGEGLEQWPEDLESRVHRGMSHLALAVQDHAAGRDPAAALERAGEDFGEALRREPALRIALVARVQASALRAQVERARGADPTAAFRRALEDAEAAVRLAGADGRGYCNVAGVCLDLAEAVQARGEDASALVARAQSACDDALRAAPGFVGALLVRARAAAAVAGGTVEARQQRLRAAVADLDEALRREPESAQARCDRGTLWARLAEIEAELGRDPTALFDAAQADQDEAVARDDRSGTAVLNRAHLARQREEAEAKAGRDPRPFVLLAITDYGRAIELSPGDPHPLAERGQAWLALGRLEQVGGSNPTESYRKAHADLESAVGRGCRSAHLPLGLLYEAMGLYEKALAGLETAQRVEPGRAAEIGAHIERVRRRLAESAGGWIEAMRAAQASAEGGDSAGFLAHTEKAIALIEAETAGLPGDPNLRVNLSALQYNAACGESLLAAGAPAAEQARRKDAAMARLEQALELGFSDLEQMRADPDLAVLRDDPRFAKLLERKR